MAKKAWGKMFVSLVYIFKLRSCVLINLKQEKYVCFIFHHNLKVFFSFHYNSRLRYQSSTSSLEKSVFIV